MEIDYVNHLPVHSKESCAISPCMDMTNLHFHGLAVSPQAPLDNVIDMLAKPGETTMWSKFRQVIRPVSSGTTSIRMVSADQRMFPALGRPLRRARLGTSLEATPISANRLCYKELGAYPFSSQLFTIVCFGLTHALCQVFILHIRRLSF